MAYGLLATAGIALACPQQGPAPRTEATSQPGELGKVSWLRDEAIAQKTAAATGKPLLVLFQEVPG